MKKEIRAWLFLMALQLTWIIPFAIAGVPEKTDVIAAEKEEDIIRWKEDCEDGLEITVKPLEQYEPDYYDVPLSEELQLHIFEECEKYNIAPAIIFAMIERESDFDASAIGDNGNSKGLMQVQPKWNAERMERLGCTNLLDPFENVTVGIDIIASLKEKNSDLYWVLMAYNGGEAYATRKINAEDYSDYAVSIVERASELEAEYATN